MELETRYVMGWEFNNITLEGGLDSTMEGVSDLRNTNGEVANGINDNKPTKCRCY